MSKPDPELKFPFNRNYIIQMIKGSIDNNYHCFILIKNTHI
uniref:Uncharacterized protein n=1 Tax=Anguilla anguilla TaxID=7936 RepID=A0A0E9UAA5_ANGAN